MGVSADINGGRTSESIADRLGLLESVIDDHITARTVVLKCEPITLIDLLGAVNEVEQDWLAEKGAGSDRFVASAIVKAFYSKKVSLVGCKSSDNLEFQRLDAIEAALKSGYDMHQLGNSALTVMNLRAMDEITLEVLSVVLDGTPNDALVARETLRLANEAKVAITAKQ